MLLQVGLCPLWGPSGDKAGVLVVLYFDQWSKSFNAQLWKYVDDTTTSEVVAKGGASNAQHIADCVSQWSLDNRVKLNSEKCKELRGRDPFNQNSNRSDREKWSTWKGGPAFSKLFRLDRTDPLSFGPKFPETLVEWIAPRISFTKKQSEFHPILVNGNQLEVDNYKRFILEWAHLRNCKEGV